MLQHNGIDRDTAALSGRHLAACQSVRCRPLGHTPIPDRSRDFYRSNIFESFLCIRGGSFALEIFFRDSFHVLPNVVGNVFDV